MQNSDGPLSPGMSSGKPSDPQPSSPTRLTERIRLQLAKMSIEAGVTLLEIARAACIETAQALGIARVGVWVLVNQRSALRCFQLYEAESGSWSSGAILQVADFPEYFAALGNRKIVPAEAALSDPKTSELVEAYLAPLGITSLLDAPIFVGGEVVGVLCCEHTGAPREWSTEERDFVASVADLLAIKYRAAQVQKLQRDLESTEARLMALDKSEALAKLALGIAHDFRNMLTAVSNSVFLLKNHAQLPDSAQEPVRVIEEATKAGGRLVAEMIDYGRNVPSKPQAINLEDEIEKFMPMLKTAVGKEYQLVVEHVTGSGRAFLDRNQFDRVLLNLVLNARDASPPGSTITIRTTIYIPEPVAEESSSTAGEDQPSPSDTWGSSAIDPASGSEGYVTVEVCDSGAGMDEQTQKKLFEPYFSTKASGTGLGMAIVDRIVGRAGGFVRVDSRPGQGTTIRVHLPRVSVSD